MSIVTNMESMSSSTENLVQGDIEKNNGKIPATKCTNSALVLLNIFYLINALLMLAAGVTGQIAHYVLNLKLEFELFSFLWIVSGIVLLLTSIFGIVGTSKKSSDWTINYGVLLMVAFAIQIAVVIVGFALISKSDSFTRHTLERLVNSTGSDEPSTMDFIQNSFQCCGVYGANDWRSWRNDSEDNPKDNEVSRSIRTPQSCCTSGSKYADFRCDNYFEKGCLNDMSKLTLQMMLMHNYVTPAIAIVQILGVIIAFAESSIWSRM